MKGKTQWIIANRLSALQDCDLIFVLKDGEIIQTGNYQELMVNKNGHVY